MDIRISPAPSIGGQQAFARVLFAAWLLATAGSASAWAQAPRHAPVIDMHMHACAPDEYGPPPLAMCTPLGMMPVWDPGSGPYGASFLISQKNPACADPVWSPLTDDEMLRRTLAQMEKYNVIGAVSAHKDTLLLSWREAAPRRILPSIVPPDITRIDAATIDRMKALKASGDLIVFGEITTQYRGLSPDDPKLEPFWKMAEDLDVPVGIHVGTGPPGTPYLSDGTKNYRARLHSALTIEEVLVRHPRLRVYLMHAGYPMLDDLLAVLYTHPQVYVDVAVIVYTQPRPAFYRYLQAIVDAGFGNRVMFGSDNMVWPETIGRAIDVIEQAPFLDEQQKRDILYNNAARFLRLSEEQIRQHHAL